MDRIVTPSTNAHWYYQDGRPCHKVAMTGKGKEGQMRDCHVGDARKLGLVPSVTNVIKILDKPQLNSWKEEQAILAALTLPAITGETIDERARRVAHDAKDQVEVAARKGKSIHKCVEEYLLYQRFDPHPEIASLVERFPVWADRNIREVFAAEKVVVGVGYAGTLDLFANIEGYGRRVVDFKSRKPYNGAVRTYPEDNIQLAAYWKAVCDTEYGNVSPDYMETFLQGTMSCFINSVEASDPVIHAWDIEDTKKGWEIFEHCRHIWMILKNYTP